MKKILMWLGLVSLLAGALTASMGSVMRGQSEQMAEDSYPGQAIIESKSISSDQDSPSSNQYRVFLTLQQDPKIKLILKPYKEDWEHYQVGDVLNILYSPSDPANFIVVTRLNKAIQRYKTSKVVTTGGLALIALGFLLIIISFFMKETDKAIT